MIEDTQKIALKQIDNQLQYKNDTLKQILSKVDDENQILNVLMEESVKTQDIIKTNHKKIEKIKNMYKSIKYCVNWDSETFIDVDAELATIFSPTVVLHLHNMDVKDLRKQFNANKKDIEKILEQYKGRYSTKVNNTLYQLMVIALEAELQNILYELKYGKLDDAKDNVKKVTSKYFTIATEGNQSIAPTIKKFIGQIEYLYLHAVEIEYEYYVRKEKIKEEQKSCKRADETRSFRRRKNILGTTT